MVRRLGPRVPLRGAGPRRPGVRQGAAAADVPRVVHAPQRPAAGVRVGVRRRQPAGARVGGAAGVRDRRRHATSSSSSGSSTSCCSTSPGGSTARTPTATTSSRAASSASTTSARSTARRRCPIDGTCSSSPTARRGWRCTASTCWRSSLMLAGHDRDLRGHGDEVLRALRAHRRRRSTSRGLWDEDDGFYYDVLRPSDGAAHPAAGALDGRAAPAVRGDDARRRATLDRLPEFAGPDPTGSSSNRPALRRPSIHVHDATASEGRLLALVSPERLRARAGAAARRGRVPVAARRARAVGRRTASTRSRSSSAA